LGINNNVVATISGSRFTGPVVTSGTFNAPGGISGSHTRLSDGSTAYITTSGSMSITTGSNGQIVMRMPRVAIVEFVLDEDVYNTQVYFFTWRGAGGDTPGNKRSGAASGIQNPGTCSPYQVPFDATIRQATLTVRGVGVQNGSVTYPVSFQTDLFDIGFTTETKITDVDFSISNSFTVGTFSVGATNFKGFSSLNVNVQLGQMLGLKFINGTGASLAGQLRNAFVTLVLEER
jgi:hypothetical protein